MPLLPRLSGPLRATVVAALAALAAMPAHALTINVTYDSTITSRTNAGAITTAFETVVEHFEAAIANPFTVNLHVAWGKVNTTAIAAGNVGETRTNAQGSFRTFSALRTLLTDAGVTTSLPTTDPTGTNRFLVPSAVAKALGVTGVTYPTYDAYIGFSSTYSFAQFDTSIAPALTYDFDSVAQHEIVHALGRTTGLISASPIYGMAADLYRYSATGVSSFSYSGAAYASIDGGATRLGTLNNGASGDRADWLPSGTRNDAQSAQLVSGREYCLSTADQRLLTGLGYTFTASAAALFLPGDDCAPVGADDAAVAGFALAGGSAAAVPEPVGIGLLLAGIASVGVLRRRSRFG
jgi:hypothetical protein